MEKKLITGIVEKNRMLAAEVYELTLGGGPVQEAFAAYEPGQFVNLYLDDSSLLLPRPISVCRLEKGNLVLVYRVAGKGTLALSRYKEGQDLRLAGPLGRGYKLDDSYEGKKAVLVGGGVGAAPLVGLAEALDARGAELTAALGFPHTPYLADELQRRNCSVYISTDNGAAGFHGNVLSFLQAAGIRGDEFFACGPQPMLKGLNTFCQAGNGRLQVSLEERMGCGYGVCMGCACRVWEGAGDGSGDGSGDEPAEGRPIVLKKICSDGPVFWGNEVVWDEW